MTLNIKDVRTQMPNYENYKNWSRTGDILGVTLHHSATANRITGAPIGSAASFFDYHVNTLGWAHGGYNYVITGTGEIEYALDNNIAAYHAGFKDPDNSEGLEYGQFWNNHYLAICCPAGSAENRTYRDDGGETAVIPNNYTRPTAEQMESLISCLISCVKNTTSPLIMSAVIVNWPVAAPFVPAMNFSPGDIREALRQAEEPTPDPEPPSGKQPEVAPASMSCFCPIQTATWMPPWPISGRFSPMLALPWPRPRPLEIRDRCR
jgi:hypothetical protein